MPAEVWLVLAVLLAALVLLLGGWLRPDLVAVLVMLTLILGGALSYQKAFQGFASPTVMTIAGLLVLGRAMVRTGVVKWVAGLMQPLAGDSRRRMLLACMLLPGLLSGFINIVAAAAFFIPVIYTLERRSRVPRTLLLMPMAAASLAGANLTLVGASHNLVVNDILTQSSGSGFGIFDFLPAGVVVLGAVMAYTLLGGWRLMPGAGESAQQKPAKRTRLMRAYALDNLLWEVLVKADSQAVSQPLSSANIGRDHGLGVLEIMRGRAEDQPVNTGQEALRDNDVLLLSGSREAVERLVAERGNFVLLGHPPEPEEMAKGQAELVEVIVPPRSPFIGKSLREIGFREKHGLTAVAVWRDGKPLHTGARDEPLQQGDGILFYGPRQNTRSLEPGPGLLWLNAAHEPEAPRELRHLAPWAALLLVTVVGVAAAGIVPIAVSALAGAGLAVMLGMVSMKEAYRAIDWQTVVLIGGMYSLGLSMDQSGASSRMADFLVGAAGGMGPLPLLMCLAVITMLLTQFLHNAAVAMIMAPVAMSVAQSAGVNYQTFAVGIVVAASATFVAPYGHPAMLLVRRPGGYRRMDYLRYGLGPCLLALGVIATFVPFWWPW